MTANTGQCLCGEVSWELLGEPYQSYNCHCKMCRKAHGSAYATYWFVEKDKFQWLTGFDSIVDYDSSHMLDRHFCGQCGSVVPYGGVKRDYYVVVAGCHDHGRATDCEIFVAHRAPWVEITSGLPQHDEYPASDGKGSIDDAPHEQPDDGHVRASCLCGSVEAEIRLPFRVAHNCHCRRCRRARAAPHATNGFAPIDAVTFTRGEERLVSYKVPGAKFFAQTFCDTCGSKMPRLDEDRGVAVIPLGCLDDDPEIAPVDHIFVADMADWHTISDELPQYEGIPPKRS